MPGISARRRNRAGRVLPNRRRVHEATAGPEVVQPALQPDRAALAVAALAVTRYVEARTGWSIKKFVRTARCYRTVQIRAGQHLLSAEDPLPPELRDAFAQII